MVVMAARWRDASSPSLPFLCTIQMWQHIWCQNFVHWSPEPLMLILSEKETEWVWWGEPEVNAGWGLNWANQADHILWLGCHTSLAPKSEMWEIHGPLWLSVCVTWLICTLAPFRIGYHMVPCLWWSFVLATADCDDFFELKLAVLTICQPNHFISMGIL